MFGNGRARILIADDHTLIAEAFNKLLASDFDVVATVHDGRSLMQAAYTLKPDVILVDIAMPLLNGLESARRIKQTLPDVKVIYVTINNDPDVVAEALRQGASAYLSKSSAASELVAAIHRALKGDRYVSPLIPINAADSPIQPEKSISTRSPLTERQLEVLQLIAEGMSMKEAATVLNLTTRTVAFHKYRFMTNLQLKNDAELVQYAMRRHIISS